MTTKRIKTEVDGVEYFVQDIMDVCEITDTSARARIEKYNAGLIGEDKLFHVGTYSLHRKPHSVEIDGKVYTTVDISEVAGISADAARYRMRQYKSGEMTAENLLGKCKPQHARNRKDLSRFVTFRGKQWSVRDISEKTGKHTSTVNRQLRQFDAGLIKLSEVFQQKGIRVCSVKLNKSEADDREQKQHVPVIPQAVTKGARAGWGYL